MADRAAVPHAEGLEWAAEAGDKIAAEPSRLAGAHVVAEGRVVADDLASFGDDSHIRVAGGMGRARRVVGLHEHPGSVSGREGEAQESRSFGGSHLSANRVVV